MFKSLKVGEKTYERLSSIGNKGDTFDKIIERLLDFYEKYNRRNKNAKRN